AGCQFGLAEFRPTGITRSSGCGPPEKPATRKSVPPMYFTQLLKQYGLHPIEAACDNISPGSIVRKQFLRRGVEHCGKLADVFTSMPKWFWDSDLDRTNLVNAEVSRSARVEADGSARLFGL